MRITLTLVMASALLLSSCGASHEDLANELIDKINEVADLLDNVDDEDSAEDCRDELKELMEDIEEVREKMDDLDDLDDDDAKELKEEFTPKLQKAMSRVNKEVAGLMATDYGQKELTEIFSQLDLD